MAYNNNRPLKLLVTIQNKWTNSNRTIVLSKFTDVQLAHKFAYYNHTTKLEDIVSIVDNKKKTLFTLRRGFTR